MRKKRIFIGLLFWAVGLSLYALPKDKVTINLDQVTMETFLNAIKEQTSINLLYNANIFVGIKTVTIHVKNEPINELLPKVLQSHGLTYKEKEGIVVITRIEKTTSAQTHGTIDGIVIDSNQQPLIGATISVTDRYGRQRYTTTDTNGQFHIRQFNGDQKLYASYIGFEKKTLPIKEGSQNYIFQLRESSEDLNEVVVTGIFNKPKVSFTGAATVITKDEIAKVGNRNLLKTIGFIDPAFNMLEDNMNGSDPNRTLNIQVRGSSTITDVKDLQSNIRNQRNLPLFILDGFEVSSERVMDMNQSDVESVVILKDASATAIYGSRGSNGVIVITSSTPQVGRLRIAYQGGLNLEIPDLSSYNLLNSFEKIDLEKIAGLYTGENLSEQLNLDAIYNQNLQAANEGVNTDWIHKPVQTGVGQYHRLNIGGGNNEFRYVLNFSYNQIKGAMKGSNRNNMNGSMTINYFLKNIRFSNDLSLGFNKADNSPYGRFNTYTTMNPYWRPFDSDGNPVPSFYNFNSQYPIPNPLYDAAQTSFSKSDYTNIRNTTMLDMNLLPGLRLNMSIGFTQQRGGSDNFSSPKASSYTSQGNTPVAERGQYNKGISKSESYQGSATLSYGKSFGKHTIYLGANGQIMQTHSETFSTTVRGFTNDEMNDISNGNSYFSSRPSTSESTVRSAGLTGTANYNYQNRYFFDLSYRLDGASSFGKLNRWAPFWSVGLGWQIAQEKWVRTELPFINLAKLKYSYGVTGSLNFSPYQALTTYRYNNDTQYNHLIGASIEGYGNPNLKWQNTKQHNIGLDLAIFHRRFTINLNYYRKTTDNLLSDVYLPLSHGYTSYKENLGVIRNIGYDMMMSYTIISNLRRQINWSVRAGASHNTNTLVKLSEAIKRANETYSTQLSNTGSNYYEYREGHSIDELYVLQSAGVDPATGLRLYKGEDGTITSETSGLRKVPVGSSLPRVNGNFGTTFRYKGLMVDMSFGFRLGAKRINQTLLSKVENAYARNNVDRRAYTQRWRQPGDISAYKDIASEQSTYENDAFVFTERALTFNSLNVTWELPKEWIKKYKMERFAITGSMSDIFYLSNMEQERGTDYPYTIKPTFTLSCTF